MRNVSRRYTCVRCGDEVPPYLALVGDESLCTPCVCAGVTAQQIDELRRAPKRIARDDAECKAHVGLWR
jgi:hypothetical protein